MSGGEAGGGGWRQAGWAHAASAAAEETESMDCILCCWADLPSGYHISAIPAISPLSFAVPRLAALSAIQTSAGRRPEVHACREACPVRLAV
jgi:hypothetical protein